MLGQKVLHAYLIFVLEILSLPRRIKVDYSCIIGPKKVELNEGDNAELMWNNTCGKKILSATFGILKDNIADPQLVNVDIINRKIYFNHDMDPKYKGRINFTGNLDEGCAWFTLKNLTVDDYNWYIASISDTVTRILPFPVHLAVRKKEREKAITPVIISSVINATDNKNTSSTTPPSTTTSLISTGVKRSSSTRSKMTCVFFILIGLFANLKLFEEPHPIFLSGTLI